MARVQKQQKRQGEMEVYHPGRSDKSYHVFIRHVMLDATLHLIRRNDHGEGDAEDFEVLLAAANLFGFRGAEFQEVLRTLSSTGANCGRSRESALRLS